MTRSRTKNRFSLPRGFGFRFLAYDKAVFFWFRVPCTPSSKCPRDYIFCWPQKRKISTLCNMGESQDPKKLVFTTLAGTGTAIPVRRGGRWPMWIIAIDYPCFSASLTMCRFFSDECWMLRYGSGKWKVGPQNGLFFTPRGARYYS